MRQNSRTLLSQDKDPANIKNENDVITFNDIANSFLERKAKEWSQRHYKTTKNRIDNYLYSLKDKDITKITKQDIISILKKVPTIKLPNNTKINSDRVKITKKIFFLIRQIFDDAVHNDYISHNIARSIDITMIIPNKHEVEHFKAELSIKNLQSMYKLINEYSNNIYKVSLAIFNINRTKTRKYRKSKMAIYRF